MRSLDNICLLLRRLCPALLFLLLIVGLPSCTTKHVGIPVREGMGIENALEEMRRIQAIDAVVSVEYEKGDTLMSGDASLKLSAESLLLRIYYMGVLAGEVKEQNGSVTTKPRLDATRSALLVNGLRHSFLWWTMSDYSLNEDAEFYILRNDWRELSIDRKTLLPVRQYLMLPNGDIVDIRYSQPMRMESESLPRNENSSLAEWYPSEIQITLRNHSARISVKSYTTVN